MRVRPMRTDELPAVLDLVARAFVEEPAVVGLVADLVAEPSFISDYSLVAEKDGALLGHVLFTRARIEQRADGGLLCLAPLAVDPAHQRTGVGTLLVTTALDRLRSQGERAVFVLGDPAYYGRFGFVAAEPLGIMPPHPVEYEGAWQALELRRGTLEGARGTVRFAEPLEDPKYW